MTTYNAFPTSPNDAPGMYLRDYFAAHALQGILAAATSFRSHTVEETAVFAYQLAEAMVQVKERIAEPTPQPAAKPRE